MVILILLIVSAKIPITNFFFIQINFKLHKICKNKKNTLYDEVLIDTGDADDMKFEGRKNFCVRSVTSNYIGQ